MQPTKSNKDIRNIIMKDLKNKKSDLITDKYGTEF